eukprot:5631244-Pyramimonas_sp.AAC.1
MPKPTSPLPSAVSACAVLRPHLGGLESGGQDSIPRPLPGCLLARIPQRIQPCRRTALWRPPASTTATVRSSILELSILELS